MGMEEGRERMPVGDAMLPCDPEKMMQLMPAVLWCGRPVLITCLDASVVNGMVHLFEGGRILQLEKAHSNPRLVV